MKYIKPIKYFLIKENIKLPEFINQDKLKSVLFKDKDFADGDVHQAIMNIAHDEWNNNNNADYSYIIQWLQENFGDLAALSMYIGKYNYQVCNGGHLQYFSNGYASYKSRGFDYSYDNIDKHEDFVSLFKKLNLDNILPSGKQIYDIISNFELNLYDGIETCTECGGRGTADCDYCDGNGYIDCDVCGGEGEDEEENRCDNCDGTGNIECGDCYGKGQNDCEECNGQGEIETGQEEPETKEWEVLDSKWYEIEGNVMEEFNDYLKSLTLDGEKITDIIKLAKSVKDYNI